MEYDPNAPAFGSKVQKIEEAKEEVIEEGTATPAANAGETETGRVPYSRFEKVHKEALEAREEARIAREEAQRAREEFESFSRNSRESDNQIPDYWKELFGDSDASKKAFQAEQKRIAEFEIRAEERAIRAYENRMELDSNRISSNLDSLEERIESFSDTLGRDLTEEEQSDLLDIVDEFTPKKKDGSYDGNLISFDKAWQIRELQTEKENLSKSRSRNAATSASGTSSQGVASGVSDEAWNPRAWGSWKSRIK